MTRFSFPRLLLAAVLCVTTTSVALGEQAETPRWLMSARADAAASSVAAERAADIAQRRLMALEQLFTKGHARAGEVVAARQEAAVARALVQATERWTALLEQAQSEAEQGASALIDGSQLVALPSESTEAKRALTTSQKNAVAQVARLEADALPLRVLDIELESLTAYEAALTQLRQQGHATAQEADFIRDQRRAIETQRATLMTRFERLNVHASLTSTDSLASVPTVDDAWDVAGQQLANRERSWTHHATLSTSRALLVAELNVAAAVAEQTAARDWQDRLARTPESALRPTEMTSAERRVRRADAAVASTKALQDAAAAGLMLVASMNESDQAHDWSVVTHTTGVFGQPVAFTFPMPQTTAVERILGPVDLQDRDVSYSAAWGGRRPSRVPEYTVWSDETRPGLAVPSSAQSVLPKPRRPHASQRSPYRDLGRTYSSGYAFGQIRSDLPNTLRFPKADAYGGPWYLPGSPTNEIRFRQRTPLRAR